MFLWKRGVQYITGNKKRLCFFPMRFRLLQHVKLENFYSQMNKAFKRGASYPNYFLTSGFSRLKMYAQRKFSRKPSQNLSRNWRALNASAIKFVRVTIAT
ncbi:hypothetical protein CEXT_164571 [Caerostris extrusa]|uniref:Ribosomal protein L20 n=1 Tax=Caerostris extrusa TaxID=172846 RepID=A0AAV4SJ37_CAEEX|nr:hypothetical protein CEXT_164571 [Caerostris extrusa]